MRRLFRILIIAIGSAALAKTADAVTVFLKNGDEVEARKVWRTKHTISALINRDVVVDFYPAEVDTMRTFPKYAVTKRHKAHQGVSAVRHPKKHPTKKITQRSGRIPTVAAGR